MKNQLFVILGASGFIGEHLTRYLTEQGQLVLCYSRKDIPNKLKGVEYHVISDYLQINFSKNATVFHLAETHHIKEVEEKGSLYNKEVVDLAEKLLKKDYRRFIYASSTTVYDDSISIPHKPTMIVPQGKTVYARAKLDVERLVLGYGGVVVRLTNTFGPRMTQFNIFSDILRQLENDIIVLREATPIRDYLWIENLVECLYKVGISEAIGIYNIASGSSISCQDLCHLILKIGKYGKKNLKFLNPDRISTLNIDIEETCKTFNWGVHNKLDDSIFKLLGETNEK